MKEPKDKRTKEYKEWKANYDNASKGLGDTIAKITKATGIHQAVKFVAGEDCGCEARQETLNKAFKYYNPKCLTESEYNYLDKWFTKPAQRIKAAEQKALRKIYNRVFNKKSEMTSCASCLRHLQNDLKKLFEAYGN